MVYAGFRTDWQDQRIVDTIKLLACFGGTVGTTGYFIWRAVE